MTPNTETVFTTEDEAEDQADYLNSHPDREDVTYQTAYVSNGDGTGAWIVVEAEED